MSDASIAKAFVATSRGHVGVRSCGDRPAIVLLQALPFGCGMMEPLMRALADEGHGSIAIDLMGYGHSDLRETRWMVEDFADNVVEVLDSMGIHAALLLGGHFTTLVATDIARRHSDRVDRLAFDGVPAWTDEERAERSANNTSFIPLDDDGTAVLARWKMALAVLRRADPDHGTLEDGRNAYLNAFHQIGVVDYIPTPADAFFGYSTKEALSALDKPALVICSPTDTLRDYHDLACDWISGASTHLCTDTNPLYVMTRPAPPEGLRNYARALLDFIAARQP